MLATPLTGLTSLSLFVKRRLSQDGLSTSESMADAEIERPEGNKMLGCRGK